MGITWQPEDDFCLPLVLYRRQRRRLPRLHVHPGKVDLGVEVLHEHLPEDVLVAHGDAPGGDEDVAAVQPLEDFGEQRARLVDGNAAVVRGDGVLGQQTLQGCLVAVADASRLEDAR